MKHRLVLSIVTSAVLLAACGGGGGGTPTASNGDSGATTLSISGTAAAGLPLEGTVTIKDSSSSPVSRIVTIEDGEYTVDVTGMTGPFIIRAEGTAGGRVYVLHSAATGADVNGTVNVTPLTDLVVANIAGDSAATLFDSGNFSAVNAAALNAEAAKLKERLQPMLTAAGVNADIDLLRTPFTPLVSAIDKALDQIRITVNETSKIATITNVITQQTLSDNLSTSASQETAPQTMNHVSDTSAATDDIPRIRASLKALSDKFAGEMPTVEALASSFADDFRHSGEERESYLSELAEEDSKLNAEIVNVAINGIDYSNGDNVIADVEFDVREASGQITEHVAHWKMRRQGDTWVSLGDQRVMEVEARAQIARRVTGGAGVSATDCRLSGLDFDLQLDSLQRTQGEAYIYSFTVHGPGLPEEGLRYVPIFYYGGYDNMQWVLEGTPRTAEVNGGSFYVMADTCASNQALSDSAIAAIPDNAVYTITARDAEGNVVLLDGSASYTERVAKRPLTKAELTAATLPSFTSPGSLISFSSYAGAGELTVSASGLATGHGAELYLGRSYGTDLGWESIEDDAPPSSQGMFSASLMMDPVNTGGTLAKTVLRMKTTDAYWRNIVIQYLWSHQAPVVYN